MEDRILYLEGSSGISGDMTVGALLDLGADESHLRNELSKLPLSHYEIEVGRIKKNGIDSCAFRVAVAEEHQPHRSYGDIEQMIMESELEEKVKRLAVKIFYVLAKAEAKVHGVTTDTVHFHEVGAVDSIIDIVAAAICICDLGITQTAVGTLREGCGTTWCQHGEIPVPVPATAELIAQYGLPVSLTDTKGEMITPTGAAIAAALRSRELLPEEMVIRDIGIGAGTKEFPHANILRAMIVSEIRKPEDVWVLETNVDDCSGEQLGFLQEELLNLGVKDVVYLPVYMKKNRPAYLLQVLCQDEMAEAAEDMIFRESTSIGIRRYRAGRNVLERRMERIPTKYGEIRMKICYRSNHVYTYPEYEDIRRAATKEGIGYREVYEAAVREAGELFDRE
ncbi:nickel pincer cofactor biosynthesis protein LarC [Ruminococcus sp. OA3]|uniref:nickel pincer cofactor biosynthesis protein LarC n=1 Tax=Ruminococcus sp. OA3 TaxID=2914164 RepID=UPI001F06580C|nr:nickel pincer cofactor biosynthesis protein LarC [Ruminococcus sp. OA3]MCH1983692.1 nickel pincer cofactor biosynthesis protein LarC [Ruminococcus sp. OA3]